ncbi:low molecular weight phosphotyrosine protein phosphatase-like [Babylonia areolata]|uniref:low molecular weight phosphotyrosine protein phosphatase-like n=1 Tax=Babylonia areolata TaxID=304850 RepID=UPI003FCFCA23
MAASGANKRSVLFICLGNICRSTIAEAIFQHLVAERGETDKWIIDSAATADYNIGRPPDKRTMATLEKNGIKGYKHKARLLTKEDYRKFDIIFGMDEENMSDLEHLKPDKSCRAKLQMLGNWDPQKDKIIVDPYFLQGMGPFDKVYEQCLRCLTAFLDAPAQ